MIDRAQQALHLLAPEPISETVADPNSYGFRSNRSTADAIVQCFICLSQKSELEAMAHRYNYYYRHRNIQLVPILNDLQRIFEVGFDSNVVDLKAGLEGNSLRLVVTNTSGVHEFFCSEDASERLLFRSSKSDLYYMDWKNLTEYQLSYLSIRDWLAIHEHIQKQYGFTLFDFNSPEEYLEQRSIDVDDRTKNQELLNGICELLL